jgi:protein-L-isoaspartate O-methyltransferase
MNSAQGLAALKAALAQDDTDSRANYRITPAGLWTRSSLDEVFDLFGQIDLARYGSMVDLGSGDGRVACLASLFTRAFGIEADPWLVAKSRRLAGKLGLSQVDFQEADLRMADLSSYDLLYIFPDKPLDWLEAMPARAWQGRLLVYGPNFLPAKLNHLATLYAKATTCSLWCR